MSQQSWSPLRIKKPTDSPSSSPELIRRPLAPRGPAAPSSSSSDEQLCGPRRTSGSFKHVSTNSLVSNSIFKRGEASPASPSHSPASPKRPSYTASAPRFTNGRSDSSSSIGLGIASERAERKPTLQERRASREKLDLENVAPLAVNIERAAGGSFKPQRKARQSTAYNSLLTNEPVSKSPFLIYGPTGTPDSPVEERKPSPKELQRAITPPPLTSDLTPRSTNNSPLRSAMANSSALSPTKRMQGPRYPTPDSYVKEEPVEETEALTPRRKTVIFADDDALEDVFEFEVESRRESLNSMASSEDSRFSEDSSESGEVALDLSVTNELSDVRSITPSPVRNALSLAHSDDDDAGSYYADEDDTLPSHIHRPALDQLSPSRDFGVLNAMDEAHVNGSVGSTGSARRPLPRVPAPMATLKEQAEQSSPEIGLHQPPPSRLPIPVSTSDTSIFSLPDIPDPSPLLIDVERLGRDTSSAPPTLEGERARLQPEGRQPVLAQRGKSPLPDSGIAARPPLKPRAATVSDTRIPTLNLESRASSSSGGESTPRIRQGDDDLPLSPSHLDSLSSPLEKLISQSSSTGEYEGACDASDDSIEESVYAGVQGDMSPSEQLESHRRALLKQRRESKLAAEANGSLEMPNGRPGRRRSLSTGDKPLDMPILDQAELGLSPSLLSIANGNTTPAMAFSESLAADLSSVAESTGRNYRLRQHRSRSVVYGVEDNVASTSSNASSAGDLETGRHWRKISRQSDVHLQANEIKRLNADSMQGKAVDGKVFVNLLDIQLTHVPLPRRPTRFGITLSNGQSTASSAMHYELAPEVRIGLEYELVKSYDLTFRLGIRLADEAHTRLVSSPSSSGSSSLENKPSINGLKKLFGRGPSSPKKPRPLSAPVLPAAREPIVDMLNSKRDLATVTISWDDLQRQNPHDRCRGVLKEFVYPITRVTGSASAIGSLRFQTFYIPALPSISPDDMPQSIDQAVKDREGAAWQERVWFEGPLSQLGLDCTYWRRRRFQLKGQQLLAISEVTKEVKMALDLSHCVAVEDLNAPIVPVPSSGASSVSGATSAATASTSATDEDEVLTSLDHSFRLTMQDGTTVSFYADDDEAKKKWVTQLERIRGRGAPIAKWIIAMRKLLGPSATTATVMSSSDSMMQPPTLPSKQGRIQPPRTRSAVM